MNKQYKHTPPYKQYKHAPPCKHTNALKEPGKKAFGKQHKTLDNKRINKTKFYRK